MLFSAHLLGYIASRIIKSPSCQLSDAVKKSFPTPQTLFTTTRNVSWNLLYWMCAADGRMHLCPG